jgi:hypothetical protein
MRKRDFGDFATVRAAYHFVARHEKLRAITETGAYRSLGDLLDRVERAAVDQVSEDLAAKGATQVVSATREKLVRDHLAQIASIARFLDEEHPELRAIRKPPANARLEAVITHAAGVAADFAKHRDLFVFEGMRPNYIEDLY